MEVLGIILVVIDLILVFFVLTVVFRGGWGYCPRERVKMTLSWLMPADYGYILEQKIGRRWLAVASLGWGDRSIDVPEGTYRLSIQNTHSMLAPFYF
jgi:hypothetical protein